MPAFEPSNMGPGRLRGIPKRSYSCAGVCSAMTDRQCATYERACAPSATTSDRGTGRIRARLWWIVMPDGATGNVAAVIKSRLGQPQRVLRRSPTPHQHGARWARYWMMSAHQHAIRPLQPLIPHSAALEDMGTRQKQRVDAADVQRRIMAVHTQRAASGVSTALCSLLRPQPGHACQLA
jgi:hypothetical protein